jgi:hypothetical protein
MALKQLAVALCVIGAASPLSAAVQDQRPAMGAPAGTPETRYCLKLETITGSVLQKVMCLTRAEWEDEWVDLDKEWASNGVGTREGKI